MYSQTVLFQILQKIIVLYSSTIGRIIDDSTFVRILNVTIAPKDVTKSPEVKDRIAACVQHSVEQGIDVTLTGHSLGGGLALHLANELAACLLFEFLCFYCAFAIHFSFLVTYFLRFPQVKSLTFNAPGSMYSSSLKYRSGAKQKVPRPLGFAVETNGDIVSWIDEHDSPVHKVSCYSINPLSCHQIQHASCRLLKDCHIEEYRKMGGASACFDTSLVTEDFKRNFTYQWEIVGHWIENKTASIRKDIFDAEVEKNNLRAPYQQGTMSFAFCLLCIFVAVFSFIKRLLTCYDHVSCILFIVVCASCYFFAIYVLQSACQKVDQSGLILGFLCPSSDVASSLPHWFYIANHFFGRVFFSLIALPIALYRAALPAEGNNQNSVVFMLKRYYDALDVENWMLAPNKNNGEQRRFFFHLIFVLAMVGCSFHDLNGRIFFSQTFALHDLFGFLMLALAVTNSIKRRLTVSLPEPIKSSAGKFAFELVVLTCFFGTLFLPPNLILLAVLALLLTPGMKPYARISDEGHDQEHKVVIAVDLDEKLHKNFFSLPKFHLFFFALLLLTFATRSFDELAASLHNVLWILAVNTFCESFARAVSKNDLITHDIWVAICVWLSFSFFFEFLLSFLGEISPSEISAYVCIIIQVFLLHAICNISIQESSSKKYCDRCFFEGFECYVFPSLLRFLIFSRVALERVPNPQSLMWHIVFAVASVVPCIASLIRSREERHQSVARRLANIFISTVYIIFAFDCINGVHLSENSSASVFNLHNMFKIVALLSLVCLVSTSKFFSGSFLEQCACAILIAALGWFLLSN